MLTNPPGPWRVLLRGLGVVGVLLATAGISSAQPDPVLGKPLVVNGERISFDEIRRHTILVSEARKLVEHAEIEVFLDREIKRQIAEDGRAAGEFTVTREEIDALVDHANRRLLEHFPNRTLASSELYPARDPRWLAAQEMNLRFRKVFLPDNPYEYPPPTVAALGSEGGSILGTMRADWDKRQAEATEKVDTEARESGRRLIFFLLQSQVLRHLQDKAEIQRIDDGIPDHLLFTIDGVGVRVDDVWREASNFITSEDVATAKRWLVRVTVLRQALEENGFLLSPEAADEAWRERYIPPGPCMYAISHGSMARAAGIPAVELYDTYFRLLESFRRSRDHEMTDEMLWAQARKRTTSIVRRSEVDVDILLVAAYDFARKTWFASGWEAANTRAAGVSAMIAAGWDWDVLLDRYSDFLDPPVPDGKRDDPEYMNEQLNSGRIRGWSRAKLMRKLGESDFTRFVTGRSLTDFIFFEQEVGTTSAPVRGSHGYYIPRLLACEEPAVGLAPTDPGDRKHLERDCALTRFHAFTQELLAQADVRGAPNQDR